MITLVDLMGNSYNLKNYKGIICLSFNIESASPRIAELNIDGRNGNITTGVNLNGRSMKATFILEAHDFLDFPLLRNEAFKLFDARTEFYIIDNREPGKRWLVRTASAFNPQPVSFRFGKFDIEFISDSSFAESVLTTSDLLTFDSENLQFGQGIPTDEILYSHSTNTFRIYNAGDEEIDPRELPLVITFRGASTNLTITNTTTGDTVTYTGSTVSGDALVLDRVKILKNGSSVFGSTNRKLIKLSPGWNEFEISGTSGSFTIDFDFRFYYL